MRVHQWFASLFWIALITTPVASSLDLIPSEFKKYSIFLFGDSTIGLLFNSLVKLCHCSTPDPKRTLSPEIINDSRYRTPGSVCSDSLIDRVGFDFHWGVSPVPPYHDPWISHRSEKESNSSTANVFLALREFQERSKDSHADVVFVFSSCIWDIARAHYHLRPRLSLEQILEEFRTNYEDIVRHLLTQLRPHRDILVLHIPHHIRHAFFAPYLPAFQLEIAILAERYQLPLFRADIVAGLLPPVSATEKIDLPWYSSLWGRTKEQRNVGSKAVSVDNTYLRDGNHQNNATSMLMAQTIYNQLPEWVLSYQSSTRQREALFKP